MISDRDAMYAGFEKSPGDFAGYGAMADLLDELGYAKLAHAFRWMAMRGKFPHKRERYMGRYTAGRRVPDAHRWAWYALPSYGDVEQSHTGVQPAAPLKTHGLPYILSPGQKVFKTHQAAVMWLAERLAKLGDVYNAHPPKQPGLNSDLSLALDTVIRHPPAVEGLAEALGEEGL